MRPAGLEDSSDEFDVFRVDMNVVLPNGQSIWPLSLPIFVQDDECLLEGSEQVHVIRYPGRLDGWRYLGGTALKSGSSYRRQFVFEPMKGSSVEIADFNFSAACTAILADPTVQQAQDAWEQQNATLKIEPDLLVIVAKQATQRGAFVGKEYKTVDGECVEPT